MKNKKIILITAALLLVTLALVSLVSCGNMSMGFGNFTYKKIHIMNYDGTGVCATVEKWYDNETGVEVKTTEYGSMYLSEGTYILIEEKCPYCD